MIKSWLNQDLPSLTCPAPPKFPILTSAVHRLCYLKIQLISQLSQPLLPIFTYARRIQNNLSLRLGTRLLATRHRHLTHLRRHIHKLDLSDFIDPLRHKWIQLQLGVKQILEPSVLFDKVPRQNSECVSDGLIGAVGDQKPDGR